MVITIVGASATGIYLAKYLSGEQMDIFIVDTDVNKLMAIDAEYNLMTVVGDGTVFATLRQAEVEKCDLFISVTNVAERNIVACGMAKSMGAKMTVARVDRNDYLEPDNQNVIRRMGVDKVIFPESLIARGIIESLNHSCFRFWYEFQKRELIMVGIRLEEDTPLTHKLLRDLNQYHDLFHVAVIRRGFRTLIPNGNYILMPDDILYLTTSDDHLPLVVQLTGKQAYDIKRVIIARTGKITELTLEYAPKHLQFTVIEKDADMARKLSHLFPAVDIINGEPSEFEVLNEAGISRADAFIALEESSEGNILACLTAKDLGVKKSIAEIERSQFFNMAESFNIGTILNKQVLMADAVFQLLIDAGAVSSKCLVLPDAVVLKLDIKPGAKIASSQVKDLKIPEEITFAGLIRDGRARLVNGQTQFKPGDTVLVVCLQGALQKAQKLFR